MRSPQAGNFTRQLDHRSEYRLGSEFPSFTAKITRVSNPNHSFSFRLLASGKAQYSAFAILVFLPISTHFTAPPEIPCTSTFLKSRSFFCGASVELKYFTKDFLNRLQTLYAQSFRITLASSVLPRLLAQSQPMLIPRIPSFFSSSRKEVYNPRAFILHAASLRQTFVHCGKFPTAASRRSLGRVSVPMWLSILSDQLLIVALGCHYHSNKLIRRKIVSRRNSFTPQHIGYQPPFPEVIPNRKVDSYVFLTRSPLFQIPKGSFRVRLACVMHAASVPSEPGSNSP